MPPLLIVALLIAAWQLYANLSGIGNDVLPSPARVLSVSWDNRGDLWDNTLPTLRATLLGFALAIVVGLTLAVLVDASATLRRALMPVLVSTQTLPIIAIAPLMVLWFGFGLTPKVLLVALVTFFPITVSFAEGFASSDPQAEALLRSMGASRAASSARCAFRARCPFLRRPAHRDHVRRGRPPSSPSMRAPARASASTCRTPRTRSAPTSCSPPCGQRAAHARPVRAHVRRRAPRDPLVPAVAQGRPPSVSAGAPKLELRGLDKSFGELEVLRDLSLEARAGEFVAILGPSGCGKSTAFSILTGGTPASAGEVLVDGAPDVPAGHFAYMPQSDALLPWRRVLDNATLGLEVRGLSRADARARVQPLLATFGLDGFERSYPFQLSGGMRQRAALLRTVVQECEVLLLDEPFGALDALTRTEMQQWLEAVWERFRWTVVLITHDVREAVYLADRIYVLSPRPATVVAELAVPLPRPRSLATLGDPRFAQLESELLGTLLSRPSPGSSAPPG